LKNYFGSNKQAISKKEQGKTLLVEWDWKAFKTTEGFPVSDDLLDWVIGQDPALKEAFLCLDEWVHKLEVLNKTNWLDSWKDPTKPKPSKTIISPGPYLLLLGDPGTGKSLLGRALSEKLTQTYHQRKILLHDVLCWKNPLVPSQPLISIHNAGEGKKLVAAELKKEQKQKRATKSAVKSLQWFLLLTGLALITLGFYLLSQSWVTWSNNPIIGATPLQDFFSKDFMAYLVAKLGGILPITFIPGGGLLIFGFFVWIFSKMGAGLTPLRGIGGSQQADSPKLLIDNSLNSAPFIDACLLPETMMWLNPRFSSSYKTNDKTWSLTGRPQQIIKLNRKRWEGNVISIKPRLLPKVEVTKNHPVLVYRPTRTHFKMEEAKRTSDENFQWIRAEDLRKGDILKVVIPQLPVKRMPEDLAWLYGIYVAKGYCRKERSNWNWKKRGEHWARELGFTLGFHERDLAENIKKTFKKYFRYDLTEDMHNQGELQLICHSAELDRKFKSMFGDSASFKHIPKEVFFAQESAKRSFLKGYWDGDRDTTTSKQLFYDLISLHILLGEIPSTYIRTAKGGKIMERQIKSSLQYTARMYGTRWHQYFKKSNREIYVPIRFVETKHYEGEIVNPETEDGIIPLPFITHNTGHGSAQLFGSVAWDPYQSGNMGTPEHQRVTAGDVHRASFGILYIDEIKNLGVDEAVTLLTVLEEGQLPIALRSRWHGGDTAAMAVSTDPAPTITFLVGAGNFDSISQIHPALMDRIYGYGKVVRMNNDMLNTVENRRKYVQFIAQEVKRFNLIPFSREACIEVIEEGRRRSDKRDALSTRFRPLISIIKTASTLAMNENCEVVEARHVKEAIESHCKTIQKQILEHTMTERGRFLEIIPEGISFGKIHGLAVVKDSFSGEMMGTVLCVKAQMTTRSEISRNYPLKGYYKVTGVAKGQSFISDSISKVRSVILQKYGVDIAQDYFTHIDFAQSFGVDGSSAGVTMAILICALMEKKGIKQDIAVTGEINLEEKGQVMITAVGGVHEKIKAAEAWGFKKVVIPKKNYERSIDPKDYKIKIVPAATLEEYLKECLVSTDNDKKQQS